MDLIGKLTGQMLSSGVYKDLPNDEPPLWVNGQNVYFADNSVLPIPGQSLITSGGGPIRGLKASIIDELQTIFFGTGSKLYLYTLSGGLATVGTGYTNEEHSNNQWSLTPWSNWMLATNNKDLPQIYKGSSFIALGGIGSQFTKLKFFIPYGEFMLGIDGKNVFFCSRANVEDWVPVATNSAGSLSPQDLDGPFMGGVLLGERIGLFTRNSMHVVDYIGPPNYFGINAVQKSPGIYGINAVTVQDKQAYGLGPGGAFVTDLSSHVYIDEGTVHKDIFADISETETEKVITWHSKHTKQIVFWWPSLQAVENDKSHAFRYFNNTWAPRGDKRTAVDEQGIFPWGLLATESGSVYLENLTDAPVNTQDAVLLVEGEGTFDIPFGFSGFGQGGFGGLASFTE